MKVLEKVAFGAVSLFLVDFSWNLLSQIRGLELSLSLAEGAFWGWLLALSVTGIFAFAGFGFPTEKLLPDRYYEVTGGDRQVALYRATGARWMRRVLVLGFWGWARNRRTYFSGTRSGLEDFERRTRESEFGHLASFVVLLPVSVDLLLSGRVVVASFALFANWVGNFYPVVIQRQHRLRIQRVRARQQSAA